MVADRLDGADAPEDILARMLDHRYLAVLHCMQPSQCCSIGSTQTLQTKAHAEDGNSDGFRHGP